MIGGDYWNKNVELYINRANKAADASPGIRLLPDISILYNTQCVHQLASSMHGEVYFIVNIFL